MTKYALSEAQKKRNTFLERDARLKRAISAWSAELIKSKEARLSLRAVAIACKVPVTTLHSAVHQKHRTQKQAAEARQLLSANQEQKLVDLLIALDNRELGCDHHDIRIHALSLLNRGKKKGPAVLGKNWVPHFLNRWYQELSMAWSSSLPTARASNLSQINVNRHFHLLEETRNKYDIIQSLDYGMDESPIILGVAGKSRRVGSKGRKKSYQKRDGNREAVTVVETICGDGSSNTPTVIFRGKTFNKNWGTLENNPIGALLCRSEHGYIDGTLSLAWLKDFDDQTREKAAGRYRRLIVDNHESHCTLGFLEYAESVKIIVVGYPSHCTHALQGLDVACFGRVKQLWGKALTEMSREDTQVTKENFLTIYHTVRTGAFTEKVILSAWRATGIWPFNPDIITPDQTAPAEDVSTMSSGIIPLPGHLRDISEALKLHQSISQTDGARTPAEQVAARISFVAAGTEHSWVSNPDDPSFSSATPAPSLNFIDMQSSPPCSATFPIDPVLSQDRALTRSPTKSELKQGILHLKSTLVDYETTMILQNSHVLATQRKLYKKENKPKTRRRLLADKGQRHMTSDEWLAALRKDTAEKENIESLRAQKSAWRSAEIVKRSVMNKQLAEDWATYAAPFKLARKRPLLKRPANIPRESTPDNFKLPAPSRKEGENIADEECNDEGVDDQETDQMITD